MSLEAQEQLTPRKLDTWLTFEQVRELEEARDLTLLVRAGAF